jgi:hypothetical protein
MVVLNMSTNSVYETYCACVGRWQTCDWTTEFGLLKLNLNGLRSTHLERLGHATSGVESLEWRKAASWVREIETAAGRAEELATRAIDALKTHEMSRSVELIQQACELERQWHSKPLWRQLELAILNEIAEHSNCIEK